MNNLLWVLQVLTALLYGSSGVMKVFMFERIRHDVPSFGALPRDAWMALGLLELLHGRAHRPLHPPLATASHHPGRRAPRHREPHIRLGARPVPRDDALDPERRAGTPHGVHRVRPDGSSADRLTGRDSEFEVE